MRFLLLLGWIALPVAAQREPAWPLEPANCGVDGQVVNSVTGVPVPDATVTLRNTRAWRTRDGRIAMSSTNVGLPGVTPPEDLRSVTTDADGKFQFTALPPGIYTLAALKDGFLPTPYKPHVSAKLLSGETIQLEPGKKAHALTIRLLPENAISGRVLGAGGVPLEGVCVKISQHVAGGQGMQLIEHSRAVTNSRGEYTIRGFYPDTYIVSALPPPGSTAYLPQFFPDSPGVAGARPIEIGEGQQLRDFVLWLRAGKAPVVRGTIETPRGATLGGISLTSPEFGVAEGTVRRTAEGYGFETPGLMPGSYRVYAWLMKDGVRYEDWRSVEVDADGIAGLVMRPAAPVELRGKVIIEGRSGARLSGVKLLLDNSYSVGFDAGYSANGIPIPVNEDGTFHMRGVPAATYRITCRYGLGGYLRAVRVGGTNVTEGELDLRSGAAAGELEILLSPGGGTIEGDVLDDAGKPALGAMVALLPAIRETDPQRMRASTVVTLPDFRGHYMFVGVAPGNYRLLAWKLGVVTHAATVLYDHEFLKAYEGRAKAVSIGPNGKALVQLEALR